MTQEFTNSFGKVFLTVKVDVENKWVHVNWIGYLTQDNVRTGANAYIAILKKANLHKVLNDTRLIIGSWDHSISWVTEEWAPKAAQDGLQYFALLTTPETFAETSASNFYQKLKSFKAEVFEEMDAAKSWLANPERVRA